MDELQRDVFTKSAGIDREFTFLANSICKKYIKLHQKMIEQSNYYSIISCWFNLQKKSKITSENDTAILYSIIQLFLVALHIYINLDCFWLYFFHIFPKMCYIKQLKLIYKRHLKRIRIKNKSSLAWITYDYYW